LIIYADVFVAVNFFLDYTLLWMAGRLGGARTTRGRLALGAGLGVLHALAALVATDGPWRSLGLAIAVPLLMLGAAYLPLPVVTMARLTVAFYAAATIVAGLALAMTNALVAAFDRSTAVPPHPAAVPWWLLPLAAGLGAVVLWGLVVETRRRRLSEQFRVRLEISLHGRSVDLPALVDSGNKLTDPFSEAPVVVVEYAAVRQLLPAAVGRFFEGEAAGDLALLADASDDGALAGRMRVIPFTSVGRDAGMLVGFRPDRVVVAAPREGAGRVVVGEGEVVIGLYGRRLAPDGSYRALVPAELAMEVGD